MLYLFLACSGPSKEITPKTAQDIVQDIPAEKTELSKETTPAKTPLKEIKVSHTLPEKFKREWPKEDWSYAKAYTFNFVPYGPGHSNFVYIDGKWHEGIEQSVDITKEEADYALALIHHTAGDVEASSCTFPRHGIVYFNESNEPIASINYCFSCEGVLIWPDYLNEEERLERYNIEIPAKDPDGYPQQTVLEIYFELDDNWRSLFLERLGLPNPSFRPQ